MFKPVKIRNRAVDAHPKNLSSLKRNANINKRGTGIHQCIEHCIGHGSCLRSCKLPNGCIGSRLVDTVPMTTNNMPSMVVRWSGDQSPFGLHAESVGAADMIILPIRRNAKEKINALLGPNFIRNESEQNHRNSYAGSQKPLPFHGTRYRRARHP